MAEQSRQPRNPENSNNESKRKGTFAAQQARRAIAEAKEALARAKESGSGTAISNAEKAVTEAEADLAGLREGSKGDRRTARREFVQEYYDNYGPYIAQLVKEDSELRDLLQEAISNGWDATTYDQELKKTDWWQDTNKTNAWLDAFRREFGDDPGGEWNNTLEGATDTVRDIAARYNASLTDDALQRIARRSIYEGWDEREFQEWFASRVERDLDRGTYEIGGTIESKANTLRGLARDFGLSYSEDWFTRRANSLLNPEARVTDDDVINDMIREAESLYPVFKGRLSANNTLRDAAGSYIGQMAQLLEMPDASQIDLKDPLLTKAFNSVMDDKGPAMMSLWDFQREIRKDDRWQQTNNAYQTYTNIGTNLAKMMGFSG